MSYPITLLVVMGAVITLMMLKVVPQLVDFLTSQGFDLPPHTLALIAFSNFFSEYWWLIIVSPIATIIGLSILYKSSYAAHYAFDKFFLKVPVIGNVILKLNLARFSHFFGITFSSGIGVLECLDTTKGVVKNYVLQEAIDQIIQNVSEGTSLTQSISMTKRFPNLVVRMFKVGEDSGNMDQALSNINFFYNREVDDAIARMISFIQPVLTVVMGGMMFWVIASVFGPLYGTFSEVEF